MEMYIYMYVYVYLYMYIDTCSFILYLFSRTDQAPGPIRLLTGAPTPDEGAWIASAVMFADCLPYSF